MKKEIKYNFMEYILNQDRHASLPYLLLFLIGYSVYFYNILLNRHYNAYKIPFKILRIISAKNCSNEKSFSMWLVNKFRKTIKSESIQLSNEYFKGIEAKQIKEEFTRYGSDCLVRLKYPRINDYSLRQGDLLVLKPYIGENEKGVILVKYNESFKKFAAIFDVSELAQNYRFILEPSTWGYQDIDLCMFAGLSTEIIVESQYLYDFKFIENLKCNLLPIRVGAGDWIDPYIFTPNDQEEKIYDVIMIASWQKLKRHDLLFECIKNIRQYVNKVALIGYPSNGRTMNNIICESEKHGIYDLIDIYENITPYEVSSLLQKSKTSIMLSKREGANKSIYESFFADVPVILTDVNIGVNRDHVNEYTGIQASDVNLSEAILYMIRNYMKYSPRNWAIEHTGYINTNKKVNNFVRQIAINSSEMWTRDLYFKKNCPNAMYVNEKDASEANAEFNGLYKFLRV